MATYYKIKPTVGQQAIRSKSPKKRLPSLGRQLSGVMTQEEAANKIVEVVFQIAKLTKDISLCTFQRDFGSLEAFDEVLLAMFPVFRKFSL